MDVFRIFYIVQMIPNCAKRFIYLLVFLNDHDFPDSFGWLNLLLQINVQILCNKITFCFQENCHIYFIPKNILKKNLILLSFTAGVIKMKL